MLPSAASSKITRKLAGFANQLRTNGFAIGPADVADALAALESCDLQMRDDMQRTLKIALCSSQTDWSKFDDIFESFWLQRGCTRRRTHKAKQLRSQALAPIWANHLSEANADLGNQPAPAEHAAAGSSELTDGSKSKLAASSADIIARTDMRNLVAEEDRTAAEEMALRIAQAMRCRLSRRWKQSACGTRISLRRTIRRSISRGGTPLSLVRQMKADKPVRIAALLDISGSMKQYSGFFLHFLRGLVSHWLEAEAYLFHTRLLHATGWMRERNATKAMESLALAAGGLDSGTRIAASLQTFNEQYAKRTITSRSVVVILSDGYDCDQPEHLAAQLALLKKRARKLVWLNPMLGWRGYEPTARSMAAALPHIDCFAAANTLAGLQVLEHQLHSL